MPKLTALGVRRPLPPGRHGDGGGLWLQVRDAEHRSWLFRYKLHGKAREMGLGPLADVSLAEVREAAAACRRLLLAGVDPIEHRRGQRAEAAAKANAITSRQVAERYVTAHTAGRRNAHHVYQWNAPLENYPYPILGSIASPRRGYRGRPAGARADLGDEVGNSPPATPAD